MAINKNKLVSVAQNAVADAVTQYQQSSGRLNNASLPGATAAAKPATQTQTTQAAPTVPATTPPESTTDYSKYKYDAADNDSYMQAIAALQAAQQNKPTYAGTYDAQIQKVYDQIVNRDKFKFNLNEDMLYQQYRDQYAQQGDMAMRDTMGQAASLTGGYSNTYAEAVGQQQYNAYLQQLNDVVPELYGMALDQYNAEGDRLMQQYGMLGDMADKEYGRYQDALNQYWQNLSYLQGRADTEYDRGYGEWYDAYKMGTEQDQIAYQKYLDQRNYDYQLGRDAVEDKRYEDEFAYQKERDTVGDNQWERQFQSQEEQNAWNQQFQQDKFNYGKEQDALDREQQAGMTAYERQLNNYGTLTDLITKTGYTPTDAELAAAGMTRAQANAYLRMYTPNSTKTSDGGSGNDTGNPDKDPGDVDAFEGSTYTEAVKYLKDQNVDSKTIENNVMSESDWSRRKAEILRYNPTFFEDESRKPENERSKEYWTFAFGYAAYVGGTVDKIKADKKS